MACLALGQERPLDLDLSCSVFGQVWKRDKALPSEGLLALWGILDLLHVTGGDEQ